MPKRIVVVNIFPASPLHEGGCSSGARVDGAHCCLPSDHPLKIFTTTTISPRPLCFNFVYWLFINFAKLLKTAKTNCGGKYLSCANTATGKRAGTRCGMWGTSLLLAAPPLPLPVSPLFCRRKAVEAALRKRPPVVLLGSPDFAACDVVVGFSWPLGYSEIPTSPLALAIANSSTHCIARQ